MSDVRCGAQNRHGEACKVVGGFPPDLMPPAPAPEAPVPEPAQPLGDAFDPEDTGTHPRDE